MPDAYMVKHKIVVLNSYLKEFSALRVGGTGDVSVAIDEDLQGAFVSFRKRAIHMDLEDGDAFPEGAACSYVLINPEPAELSFQIMGVVLNDPYQEDNLGQVHIFA